MAIPICYGIRECNRIMPTEKPFNIYLMRHHGKKRRSLVQRAVTIDQYNNNTYLVLLISALESRRGGLLRLVWHFPNPLP